MTKQMLVSTEKNYRSNLATVESLVAKSWDRKWQRQYIRGNTANKCKQPLTHLLKAFLSFPVQFMLSKLRICIDGVNVPRATADNFIRHLKQQQPQWVWQKYHTFRKNSNTKWEWKTLEYVNIVYSLFKAFSANLQGPT